MIGPNDDHSQLSLENEGAILHPVTVQCTVRLNEKGLNKLEEARQSGTAELPAWLTEDMENAETDTN